MLLLALHFWHSIGVVATDNCLPFRGGVDQATLFVSVLGPDTGVIQPMRVTVTLLRFKQPQTTGCGLEQGLINLHYLSKIRTLCST